MNVLVTGATGFIGAVVVRALLRRGHGVVGLVRDPAKAERLRREGMAVEVGDMWKPETYRHLPARVDAVIHAAQSKPAGRWNARNARPMHASDALMTGELAIRCRDHKIPFLYTSGGLVYKGYEDSITEETPLRPCLLAKGHADREAELMAWHKSCGLRAMIITPGFVYGGGGLFLDMIDLLRKGRYKVMGRGDNFWSMVHVEDLAEVYVLALERGRPGERYLVGDDEPLPRRLVVHRMCDALGLPRAGSIPRWLLGLVQGFGLVEALKVSMKLRNDKAKRELGWQPRYRTYAEGLPAVVAALESST
jgi:nucleoside-diphosphate-sugar epimerase